MGYEVNDCFYFNGKPLVFDYKMEAEAEVEAKSEAVEAAWKSTSPIPLSNTCNQCNWKIGEQATMPS